LLPNNIIHTPILNKSVDAFEDVMDNPKTSIPQSLIDQLEGIVIFPAHSK
jgi:hypothetical protein